MEIHFFYSLNILVNVKVWRESIATVITATVNMGSASLATEDVEVTERSTINIITVTSFAVCVIFVLRE